MESKQNETELAGLPALRKSHPLHQQVMAVLADSQAPLQDLRPILRALSSTSALHRKERTVAFWLVIHANWSDDQRLTISETLSKVVDKAMKASRADRVILRWIKRGMLASGIFLLGMVALFGHVSWSIGIAMFFLSALLTIVGSCVSLPLSLWIDHRKLKQLSPVVETLGQLGQPACIASIAKASVHGPLREVAASALIKVTSGLQPTDYGTLSGEAVPALCSALTATSPQTVVVILKALTLIGDGRAINTVAYLSQNAFRLEVREAASNLLPILHQRALANQASSLLLRASCAPSDAGKTLLRPARDQSVADPTQLLRMATQDGERP